MNLRLTMLVLTIVTILSASAGGYFYYSSLKKTAYIQAERRAYSQLRTTQKNITSFLSENIKPVRTLAGMPEIKASLQSKQPEDIRQANQILDHFNTTLESEACYIMDTKGFTIASSNRNSAESFIDKNFSFRPYFQKAMRGSSATYLALGTTSKRRGVYCSYPVFSPNSTNIAGATIIKASIERIENELLLSPDEYILLTDPTGLIFISTNPQWRFTLLGNISEENKQKISQSRQFGTGPWLASGLIREDNQHFSYQQGTSFYSVQTELDRYPGWQLIYLSKIDKIHQELTDFIKITRPLILVFCLSIGTAVFLLYVKASMEIARRKETQTALTASEKRYRNLYQKTPAMLHSIDRDGKLLSVSDHWLTTLGYTREEVLGKDLTHFYTEPSKKHAEEVVIPSFFMVGFCNDIPYQFIKKNGGTIDILLSAIAERDEEGNIIRSLAVSLDVTERNRAQNALQRAKEDLSRYSQELEQEVMERTLAINSILTNTPDVVYIVDRKGHLTLVNKRFEEIFSVKNETLGNKTIFDIFAKESARAIHTNNLQVFTNNSPLQVEEQFAGIDGDHTYLSVKFPIYDHKQQIEAICSISTDVTDLYKAQSQLRRLSASILQGQEKERSAIARELHDELGQVLTALRMEAVSLSERLHSCDPEAGKRAQRMCLLIDNTIDDVRGMAIRLRPGVLDDLGLFDALEWYTSDFEKRTGISCFLELPKTVRLLSDTITTAAYRITQEALTNAARHSGTSNIKVTLTISADLVLKIQDYGTGFETSSLDTFEGLGIAGMKERANLAGGLLLVNSTLNKGTTITFSIHPLDQNI